MDLLFSCTSETREKLLNAGSEYVMHALSQVGRSLTSFSTRLQGETMATSVSDTVVSFSISFFLSLVCLFLICAGMYFDHPEIVPDGLLGDFRFNKGDEAVGR